MPAASYVPFFTDVNAELETHSADNKPTSEVIMEDGDSIPLAGYPNVLPPPSLSISPAPELESPETHGIADSALALDLPMFDPDLTLVPSNDSTPMYVLPDPTLITSGPEPLVDLEPSHVLPSERNARLAPVVGTSRFEYDPVMLDSYLEHVLKFWRGEREPVGVDIEDANRCKLSVWRYSYVVYFRSLTDVLALVTANFAMVVNGGLGRPLNLKPSGLLVCHACNLKSSLLRGLSTASAWRPAWRCSLELYFHEC